MSCNKSIIIFLLMVVLTSCASYEHFRYITEEMEMPTRVFAANYTETWQAVLQVMQKYNLTHKNEEAGVIRTDWNDNTNELNFSDSFGDSDAVKAAKYKLIINLVKGFRGRQEVTKVTLYKRQFVEQDFLQGWKEIPTDGILEKTLMYRIKRVIQTDMRLRKIEKEREQKELKNF